MVTRGPSSRCRKARSAQIGQTPTAQLRTAEFAVGGADTAT